MLDTTLDVAADSDHVAFGLTVTNDGEDEVTLSFSDGQRTRFTVTPASGGDAVWRSDEGQMFMQMLGEETVPAGDSLVFGAEWESPEPGEYEVVGEVTCSDHELSAEETFSV